MTLRERLPLWRKGSFEQIHYWNEGVLRTKDDFVWLILEDKEIMDWLRSQPVLMQAFWLGFYMGMYHCRLGCCIFL